MILQAVEILVDRTQADLRVFRDTAVGLPPTQAHAAYPEYAALVDEHLEELQELATGMTPDEVRLAASHLRAQLVEVIDASRFLHRVVHKPWGYAGDAVMMTMLYDNAFEGPDAFACVAHYHPVQSAAAQAVRSRADLVLTQIRTMAASRSAPVRVASIAAGPAWELRNLYATPADAQRFHVSTFDQDPRALALVERATSEIGVSLGVTPTVDRIHASVRDLLKEPDPVQRWGQFDFIYAMGLFDYLPTPAAAALLTRLRELLTPGGRVCVGNFTPDNPTRTLMDWWMDWPLIYRSADELAELLAPLTPTELVAVGPQLFLCLDVT